MHNEERSSMASVRRGRSVLRISHRSHVDTRVCVRVLSSRDGVRCLVQSRSTGTHGCYSAEGALPAREWGAALGPGWEPTGRPAADMPTCSGGSRLTGVTLPRQQRCEGTLVNNRPQGSHSTHEAPTRATAEPGGRAHGRQVWDSPGPQAPPKNPRVRYPPPLCRLHGPVPSDTLKAERRKK